MRATKKKGRAYIRRPEHDEQVKLVAAARAISDRDPNSILGSALDMLYAVPNGGYRPAVTAAAMKAEGQRAGVPDLCLPVPSRGYHSMYIEMKAGKNKQTPDQVEYMAKLRNLGHWCVVAYSGAEAMESILHYLEHRLSRDEWNLLALNGIIVNTGRMKVSDVIKFAPAYN